MKYRLTTLISVLTLPISAYAAPTTFKGLVDLFIGFIESTIPVVISLVLLFFLINITRFILNSGDSGVRESAKQSILWGVIALTVLFTLWGIIYFLGDSFGLREHF